MDRETVFQAVNPRTSRPILLVHGFACSARVLSPLARHLRHTLQREVIRVPLCPGRQDLRASAHDLQEVVGKLSDRDGFEYTDIVAHSMGGLTATYLLKRIDLGRRIRSLITLGTPHQGTPLARIGVLMFGVLSRAIWQMLPGSRMIEELRWLPVPEGCRVVSIAGGQDLLVPPRFARLTPMPGHGNRQAPTLGHAELLISRRAFGLVRSMLCEIGSASRPAGPAEGTGAVPIRSLTPTESWSGTVSCP